MKKVIMKKLRPAISMLKHNRKRVIIGLILIAIGFFIVKKITTQPTGMLTTRVISKSLDVTFSANGQVKARESIDLKFLVPGKIAWVGVKNGDSVYAWQAVAGLDSRDVTKNLELALRDYSKQRNAYEQTVQVDYQGRYNPNDALNDTMKRILESNQWDLEKAVLAVELKNLAVEIATLVSPIKGTVTATNGLVAGLNLTAGDAASKAIRVVDLTTLYFEARVDEIDYGEVFKGQEAHIVLDAFPDASCTGSVVFVNREGRETTGGVITIPVEVSLDDCKPDLATFLNGHVDFVTKKVENSIVIPKKYIVPKGDVPYVWVQTGKSTRNRTLKKVTTGQSSSTEVQITNGLSVGDTIIFIPN